MSSSLSLRPFVLDGQDSAYPSAVVETNVCVATVTEHLICDAGDDIVERVRMPFVNDVLLQKRLGKKAKYDFASLVKNCRV